MSNVLEEMLSKYDIKNENDKLNAIKEIIQEIILCGLSRSDFFDKAAFYGGTALRIFYGLDRFSEDLDFSLINPDNEFDFSSYFTYIEKEVNAYGLKCSINEKVKSNDSNIKSAFLKGDTMEHILKFFPDTVLQVNKLFKDIKIKFEIDVNPPNGANYECKYKLLPSAHKIKLYDESSLFAGKVHAILCRGWNNRVKGRDLYDYIFYLSKGIKVNKDLLKNKLLESNFVFCYEEFDIDKIKSILCEKFDSIDYEESKKDVVPFIKDESVINIWNKEFFKKITEDLLVI